MAGLLVIVAALAPCQDAGSGVAKDARAIRGEWKCTALAVGGEKQPAEAARKLRLVVKKAGWYEHADGDIVLELRYKLQPGGVVRFHLPDDKKTYFFGRYELKGGTLRVCWPGPLKAEQEPRPPARLESPEGSRVTLSSWKQVGD